MADLAQIQLMALHGDDCQQLHTWHVKPSQQCTTPNIIVTNTTSGNVAHSGTPCGPPTSNDNPHKSPIAILFKTNHLVLYLHYDIVPVLCNQSICYSLM